MRRKSWAFVNDFRCKNYPIQSKPRKKMKNISTAENQRRAEDYIWCRNKLDGAQLVFILTLDTAISIAAILGNVLFLIALRNVPSRSLHPPSKLLFECLAFTDLIVGFCLQPLRIVHYNSQEQSKACFNVALSSWIVGLILCAVSLQTLVFISVDRLLALTLGLRYRQVVNLRRVRITLVLVWLVSIATGWSYYHFKGGITSMISYSGTSLCLTISAFCFITIFAKIRRHQAQVHDQIHHGQQIKGSNRQNFLRYKKTVIGALWVQLTLLVCYIPYTIERVFNGETGKAPIFVSILAASLVALNSALNPVVYSWKMKDVRQAVRVTIRQFCSST